MNEIWKDIKGYEGLYQVSNKGRVKSIRYIECTHTYRNRILHSIPDKWGNRSVYLSFHCKQKSFQISRLVIETFTNQQLKKTDIIMYKDNDKKNCNLKNLYIIPRKKRTSLCSELGERKCKKYEYYGQMLRMRQIAEINKVNPNLIWARINILHWSIYEAAEIPREKRGKESGKMERHKGLRREIPSLE